MLKSVSPISCASWSFALKSAAVSVANAVGSKPAAVRRRDELAGPVDEQRGMRVGFREKLLDSPVRALKSSSVKDQLLRRHLSRDQASVDSMFRISVTPRSRRTGVRSHATYSRSSLSVPIEGRRAQIAQRREPAQRVPAEKIAPMLALQVTPRESPARQSRKKAETRQLAVTTADHIARRAESACAMVTPSAYSRSPPTGSPRAMRVTES